MNRTVVYILSVALEYAFLTVHVRPKYDFLNRYLCILKREILRGFPNYRR